MVRNSFLGKPARIIELGPYLVWLSFILLILSTSPSISNEKVSEKRILFLFSLSKNEPRLLTQLKYLSEDLEGQEERDLMVSPTIMVQDKSRDAVQTPENNIENFGIKYPIINIRNPFCVILVGKDGKEKLRSYEPIGLKKLFSLIDQMPMRIEEMKLGTKP